MAHNTTKRCILIERIRNYVKSHMNRYKKYKIAHHQPTPPSPQSYHEPIPDTIQSKIKSFIHIEAYTSLSRRHASSPLRSRSRNDFGSNNKNGTSSSDQIDTYTSSSPKSIIPSWKAPPIHGLQNSSRIIPEYYTSTNLKNGILKINYYDMIIDDIRNLRPLSSHQMKYIRKNLTHTEYYNIIHEYNQVMQVYLESY
jgi:hypothetical protein